jgi:hypothetical protein
MIPAGSVTADQEMVNGTVTCAPFAGPSSAGAGGPAGPVGVGVGVGVLLRADVDCGGKPIARMISTSANDSVRMRESFMSALQRCHVRISQPTC